MPTPTEVVVAPPVSRKLQGAVVPDQRVLATRFAQVEKITLRVEHLGEDGVVDMHGTGTLVTQAGGIITAAHVVSEVSDRYRAVLDNGTTVKLEVVARDEAHDLAAAKLRPADDAQRGAVAALPWVELGPAAAPGDWVVCGGHASDPADHAATRSAGVVQSTSYVFEPKEFAGRGRAPKTLGHFDSMLQADCGIARGMSGGAMIDDSGELVGIIVGTGIASPVAASPAILRSLALAPPRATQHSGVSRAAKTESKRHDALALTNEPGDDIRKALVVVAPSGRSAVGGISVGRPGLVLTVKNAVAKADGEMRAALPRVSRNGLDDKPCSEIVAIRGELALLRCEPLDDAVLTLSIAEASLAAEIRTISAGNDWIGSGFVTGLSRTPGEVRPPRVNLGCGMVNAHHYEEHPPVEVGEVFAHDADRFTAGEAVVDLRGAPIGIDVANVEAGVSFAVPLRNAMARFPEIR
ncbi:MAG: trypsin-like peptidase domain-containing protein [Polyangiaceae bacterium]|nr:trypsin-like peptidase domain-containing protein [Polyangiaceae bacterium]